MGKGLELALIIIHAGAARQSSAWSRKDAGAIAVRLVGTAVLRGCRRAPRPSRGRRLRVYPIAHIEVADRPGPTDYRRGRLAVCEGSGGPPYTRSVESRAHHSWNYPETRLSLSAIPGENNAQKC